VKELEKEYIHGSLQAGMLSFYFHPSEGIILHANSLNATYVLVAGLNRKFMMSCVGFVNFITQPITDIMEMKK